VAYGLVHLDSQPFAHPLIHLLFSQHILLDMRSFSLFPSLISEVPPPLFSFEGFLEPSFGDIVNLSPLLIQNLSFDSLRFVEASILLPPPFWRALRSSWANLSSSSSGVLLPSPIVRGFGNRASLVT